MSNRMKESVNGVQPSKTAGYRPVGGGAAAWAYGDFGINRAIWHPRWAEMMLCDSQVALGTMMLISPLCCGEVEIKADAKVEEYLREQIETIQGEFNQILTFIGWGYQGFEVIQRIDPQTGECGVSGVKGFHPDDARPRTYEGQIVQLKVRHCPEADNNTAYLNMAQGEALWFAFNARYGSLFGISAYRPAFWPWMDKVGRDGAQEIYRQWYFKNAYRGEIIRFPMKEYEGVDGLIRSGKAVAQGMMEALKTGGLVALPSSRDDKGDYEWQYEYPKMGERASDLAEYEDRLNRHILRGLGLPDDVIEQPDSGGTYGGRRIGWEAFLTYMQLHWGYIVRTLDAQLLRSLVRKNFEKSDYKIKAASLLDSQRKDASGQGAMVPGGGPSAGAAGPGGAGVPLGEPSALPGQGQDQDFGSDQFQFAIDQPPAEQPGAHEAWATTGGEAARRHADNSMKIVKHVYHGKMDHSQAAQHIDQHALNANNFFKKALQRSYNNVLNRARSQHGDDADKWGEHEGVKRTFRDYHRLITEAVENVRSATHSVVQGYGQTGQVSREALQALRDSHQDLHATVHDARSGIREAEASHHNAIKYGKEHGHWQNEAFASLNRIRTLAKRGGLTDQHIVEANQKLSGRPWVIMRHPDGQYHLMGRDSPITKQYAAASGIQLSHDNWLPFEGPRGGQWERNQRSGTIRHNLHALDGKNVVTKDQRILKVQRDGKKWQIGKMKGLSDDQARAYLEEHHAEEPPSLAFEPQRDETLEQVKNLMRQQAIASSIGFEDEQAGDQTAADVKAIEGAQSLDELRGILPTIAEWAVRKVQRQQKKVADDAPGLATGKEGLQVGREPWEMTAADYRDAHEGLRKAVAARDAAQASVGDNRWGDTRRFQGRSAGNRLDALDKARNQWSKQFDRASSEHRKHVERAIADGKSIPAEVLRDYPDLQLAVPPTTESAVPEWQPQHWQPKLFEHLPEVRHVEDRNAQRQGFLFGHDADSWLNKIHRAPKGYTREQPLVIEGRPFVGGEFIPLGYFQAATPEQRQQIIGESQERNAALLAKPDVSTTRLRSKIRPHDYNIELLENSRADAQKAWAAIKHHHGSLALHRLEELIEDDAAALKNEQAGSERWQLLTNQMAAYKQMVEWAERDLDAGRLEKSGITYAETNKLHVDPERFQYKISVRSAGGAMNKAGVGEELKGVKKFDPNFAGTLLVWHDPQDGKDYVVNGHHRHELASRAGYPLLSVRYIRAKNAAEARAIGAAANIAEGKGTAVDAAKFMRDTGLTPDDLAKKGISLKGQVAADGLTLAGLAPSLFQKLTTGTLDQGRALAIAGVLKNHDEQEALFKELEQAEKDGGKKSDAILFERAKEIAETPRVASDTAGMLFADDAPTRSLYWARSELKAWLRRQIASEANAFGSVASKRRKGQLEGGPAANVLDIESNRAAAQEAEAAKSDFNVHVNAFPELSSRINRAAEAMHNSPKDKERIQASLWRDVREILRKLGSQGPQFAGHYSGGEGPQEQHEEPHRVAAGAQFGFGVSEVYDQIRRELASRLRRTA